MAAASRRRTCLKTLAILLLTAGGTARAQPPAPVAAPQTPGPGPSASPPPEIVVTAGRGLNPSEVPVAQLSAAEVGALGVDTATELLDQIKPRTASSMSTDAPIVLVNGRVAGSTELDSLPSEAILRVDILAEKSALRYGFDDTQKVVNLILREHYRGGTLGVTGQAATEGGGRSDVINAGGIRVEQEAESSLRLDHRDTGQIRESERGIDSPGSPWRTLLPSASQTRVALTLVRPLLSMRPSLEASADVRSGDSLQGLADETPPDDSPSASDPITQHTGSTALHLAARLTGPVGRLIWSVAASGDESRSWQHLRAGAEPLDRGASTLDTGRLEASLGGPVLHLPAGPLEASVHVSGRRDRIHTESQLPDAAPQDGALARNTGSAQMRARVPLTSPPQDVLAWAGELTLRLSAGVDVVSGLGTLGSHAYGFTWSPADHVYLNADLSGTQLAPGLSDLQAPAVETPGVETYDFVTGESALVTQITGGNPDLLPTQRRALRLGAYLGTFLGDSSLWANFERRRDRDPTGPLPPLTAAVEAAFPERFVRDTGGTLSAVDERAVNLAAQARDVLIWGINVGLPFTLTNGATAGSGGADGTLRPRAWHLMISLQDSWYLRDAVQIRNGLPVLDLLDGVPLGSMGAANTGGGAAGATGTGAGGAQPAHTLQLWASFNYQAVGAQISGRWMSAARVDAGTPGGPQTLRFPALATAGLRLFADMGRLLSGAAGPWAKGLRLSVAVSNLLDARQHVTGGSGLTPAAFAPGYLDPLGRAVTLNLRKTF